MNYFTPPCRLVLHSALDPDDCEHRLREAIDIERHTVFSLSSYRGTKPFLGKIDGQQIRILQRTYGRNAFPVVFSGDFQAKAGETRVIGTLDLELTSKIAVCLLSTFSILVLIPIIIYSRTRHPLLSALFACAYLTLALLAPRILRGNGLSQEKDIANFLKSTIHGSDDPPSSAGG